MGKLRLVSIKCSVPSGIKLNHPLGQQTGDFPPCLRKDVASTGSEAPKALLMIPELEAAMAFVAALQPEVLAILPSFATEDMRQCLQVKYYCLVDLVHYHQVFMARNNNIFA